MYVRTSTAAPSRRGAVHPAARVMTRQQLLGLGARATVSGTHWSLGCVIKTFSWSAQGSCPTRSSGGGAAAARVLAVRGGAGGTPTGTGGGGSGVARVVHVTYAPAQVARMAVARLPLPEPRIGIAPRARPGSMGLVGLPVWMWTPPAQWRPRSVTAAVPGQAVTATAKLESIDWHMGDGSTVTCHGPGTPFEVSYGITMSPDCGYRFEHTSADQPGQQYRVTATAHYHISWSGAAAGAADRSVSSSVAIRVGELQVLTQ